MSRKSGGHPAFLPILCRAMEKKQAEDKTKDLADTDDTLGDFSPAVLPIDPGGGIAPGSFAIAEPPPRDFEAESCCTVGPCQHYWRIETPIETANPISYAELGLPEPKQIVRTCLAHPGTETQLSGDLPVLQCNRHEAMNAEAAASQRRHLIDLKKKMQQRKNRNDATATDIS